MQIIPTSLYFLFLHVYAALLTDRGEKQMLSLGKYLAAKHGASSGSAAVKAAPIGEIIPEAISSGVLR